MKLENLVGREVLCTQDYYGVTKGKEYEIVSVEDDLFMIIEDNGVEQGYCISHINNGNLKLVPEEWEPKQGDKVLASDDGVNYTETPIIFISIHKDYFVTESKKSNKILKWKYIKPYEDEIKVGDWVFLNDEKGVCKITDKHDLKEVNNKLTSVKNLELIKLLNEEL